MAEDDRKANEDERTGWDDKGLYNAHIRHLDETTTNMVNLNCMEDQVLRSDQCTETPNSICATGKGFDRVYLDAKRLETKYGVPNRVADSYKERFDEAKESLIRRLGNE